jgi:hypothetical protein
VAAGSSSLSVCSAAGACTQLSVLVNGVSSNTQLTFSNNNLSLAPNASTMVTLYGNGGYYLSSSNNQNVATIAVSGNKVNVSALIAGSANATICQTGGQCSVLYVAVVSPNNSTTTTPTFSSADPNLIVGQTSEITISGGASSNYYISSNSNPTIAQANLTNNKIVLLGKSNGSTVVVVCAASNNCNSLPVTVKLQVINPTPTTTTTTTTTTNTNTNTNPKPKYKFTRYLSMGVTSNDVRALQIRLTWEKVYTGPITGKFGAQTLAGVKAFQKKYGITQLGVVGPATRAILNK